MILNDLLNELNLLKEKCGNSEVLVRRTESGGHSTIEVDEEHKNYAIKHIICYTEYKYDNN